MGAYSPLQQEWTFRKTWFGASTTQPSKNGGSVQVIKRDDKTWQHSIQAQRCKQTQTNARLSQRQSDWTLSHSSHDEEHLCSGFQRPLCRSICGLEADCACEFKAGLRCPETSQELIGSPLQTRQCPKQLHPPARSPSAAQHPTAATGRMGEGQGLAQGLASGFAGWLKEKGPNRRLTVPVQPTTNIDRQTTKKRLSNHTRTHQKQTGDSPGFG